MCSLYSLNVLWWNLRWVMGNLSFQSLLSSFAFYNSLNSLSWFPENDSRVKVSFCYNMASKHKPGTSSGAQKQAQWFVASQKGKVHSGEFVEPIGCQFQLGAFFKEPSWGNFNLVWFFILYADSKLKIPLKIYLELSGEKKPQMWNYIHCIPCIYSFQNI